MRITRRLGSLVCTAITSACLTSSAVEEAASSVEGKAGESLPSSRQIRWQEREVEALIHFGINTFTGREWGGGKEDPSLFAPTDFDSTQWVEAAKAFDAKAITLTAKHHDGFCLWPTATTDFSVKSSDWRGGGGDVVKEVAEACRSGGIGFGVYLSPADFHNPNYGRNSKKYNDYFVAQLRELLTNYGEITQVFFDGAEPPHLHQNFDWQRFYAVVRELQPNAVISIRGPDVRWVGNEIGLARETEWSVVPIAKRAEDHSWPNMMGHDLGGRDKIESAQHLHWYPAVADVSLRNSWFWKPNNEKSIKSLQHLLRIYEGSVGRNAGLQLNIAPDRTGRIPEADVGRLKEFGDTLRAYFTTNLAVQSNATISDENGPDQTIAKRSIKFKIPTSVRYVVLQEDITKGQRIEKVDISVVTTDAQEKIHSVTTVGWKRIVKVEADNVVEIIADVKESRAAPQFTVAVY